MLRSWKALLVSLGLLVTGSCSDAIAPAEVLESSFAIEPGTVQAGDTFYAVLTITNPTDRTITVTSGSTCLTVLMAYAQDELVPLEGTGGGCGQLYTDFHFPASESRVWNIRLVALLQEDAYSTRYTVPPPPGEYLVRARMGGGLSDLEDTVLVVP